jgi:hypothetical protein
LRHTVEGGRRHDHRRSMQECIHHASPPEHL